MWAAVATTLAVALVVTLAITTRRNKLRVDRINRILRADGDDGFLPRTLDGSLDRLVGRLRSEDTPEHYSDELVLAMDEVPVGVVVADADGTIICRNRAATPYKAGRHGNALAEAVVKDRMRDALLGHSSDDELRLHGPDRTLHIVGAPLVAGGELIGAIVLVDDVSEQHRIDAVRRDFVANVSHELRTPVGALSLLAETMLGEQDPEVLDRFMERIQAETVRLTTLIDDLLDLSRIEGGLGDRTAPVSLAAVLRTAAAAVGQAAEHADVSITVDVGDDVTILGDEAQLVSAVTNLFENAVKYSTAGGAVDGRLVAHGDEAGIAIVDEGVGIPQRDLNRIFERFYRVDRGRSSESGGTGLGLSIVRNVAVNHGGRVEVVSQEGAGSTFTLVLPLHAGSDESLAKDREAA